MIKQLRNSIDTILNSIEFLLPSREVSLVKTSLQLGFAWLGEALKENGSQSPYTESENPKSSTIEPKADSVADSLLTEFMNEEPTQTARVKLLRGKMELLIKEVKQFRDTEQETSENADYHLCLYQSFASLKLAKIWLGWELGRIRDVKEDKGVQKEQNLPLRLF